MNKLIKKTPVPMAGLMLALAAMGNLISSYGNSYRSIFGILSAIAMLLLTTKFLTNSKGVLEDLNNPVVASVSPTFSMGIMILATYINPFFPSFAYGFWMVGLLIHCVLIIFFTKRYILNFNIKKVFPSYFVVYVGIVVGSVTAPAFEAFTLGQLLFWFGFISYLVLLPIILYRVFKIKEIPEPAIPSVTIFAAPASLCLAGYISTFPEKNISFVVFLTILSLIMTLGVLFYMPKMLKLKFYPSYSAFTFPFVISGIAIMKTNVFLLSTNHSVEILKTVVLLEEFIAVTIVLYVLIRYINFLLVPILSSNEILTKKTTI